MNYNKNFIILIFIIFFLHLLHPISLYSKSETKKNIVSLGFIRGKLLGELGEKLNDNSSFPFFNFQYVNSFFNIPFTWLGFECSLPYMFQDEQDEVEPATRNILYTSLFDFFIQPTLDINGEDIFFIFIKAGYGFAFENLEKPAKGKNKEFTNTDPLFKFGAGFWLRLYPVFIAAIESDLNIIYQRSNPEAEYNGYILDIKFSIGYLF